MAKPNKKRRIKKAKAQKRKTGGDGRFRSQVIGKSHDPRDIDFRDSLDVLTGHYMEDNF